MLVIDKVIHLIGKKRIDENADVEENIVTYEIFNGCENEQKLFNIMLRKKIPGLTNYKIMKFKEMYYAITMENYGRKIVIGKDTIWYVTEGKFEHRRANEIKLSEKLKSPMKQFNPYNVYSLGVIKDLLKVDKNLKQYDVRPDARCQSGYQIVESNDTCNCYINALGLAFVSPKFFITKDTIPFLKDYFTPEYLDSFKTLYGEKIYKCINTTTPYPYPLCIYAINPFHSTVITSCNDYKVKFKVKAFFYGLEEIYNRQKLNPNDITINMYYKSEIKDVDELEEILSSLK